MQGNDGENAKEQCLRWKSYEIQADLKMSNDAKVSYALVFNGSGVLGGGEWEQLNKNMRSATLSRDQTYISGRRLLKSTK